MPLPLGLSETAAALAVPPESVVAAAVARVVSLLAGEPEVTIGYADRDDAAGSRPAALRVVAPGGSWRELVRAVQHALTSPDRSAQPFDVQVRSRPGSPPEPGTAALTVTYAAGGLDLASAFDAEYLARVAGYLSRALASLVADPDQDYHKVDLLSAAERHHLVHERGGPDRPLPDRPFHQLFADQAGRTPQAPAVVHAGSTWSYQRLDRAANAIAHALLADGVQAEDVVAIATRRHPGWVAAVIGALRAGAAYLPVEPTYPPARVATLLEQSRCATVLADAGVRLPAGTGPVRIRVVDEILAAAGPDQQRDPGVPVGLDQLAYIYFTSGSTGTPKGAMCEHRGMVNHLLAKIDDFGLGADDIVVQNAQLSFDISLWQFAAALMVGAGTLLVSREDTLDVPRFLDLVTGGRATVLQVVPSYLDILLRQVERQPRDLTPLRLICVTGEAVTAALVHRWFARYPRISLVNAYGATEASDDTTHEIMSAPPDSALVPVGRPVNNVTVYVLGPGDRLQPLGSPGELAFSGICVGRGYLHDPVRTAEVFGPDPYQAGQRMYRTGDFGRWLPSGSLEFHGRRDEQVKVHGVRIELGEVESRLLEHPEVAGAAVVVTAPPGADASLTGFYTTDTHLDGDRLRHHLGTVLPASAVPARLHRLDALPLTENGKVDKAALTRSALALAVPVGSADREPRTPVQQRIAQAWAQALRRPADQIGLDAHFFDIGGTSLSALRVVAALDGLVSLDQLVRFPVLRGLAAAVDGAGAATEAGALLRPLTDGDAWALVCLPAAAGVAIAFRPLAEAIAARDPHAAVYGLQPPGHDLGRPDEVTLEVAELAKLVADEAAGLGRPLALFGHGAGAALALEVARRLGATVRHVFIAARLPAPTADLAREIATVAAAADADLVAELIEGSAVGAVELSPADRAQIARVYRHDTRAANQYLIDLAAAPAPLPVPVTSVAPDLPGTRPDETAEIVLRAVREHPC